MESDNGKVTEVWGQKFQIVKNGLDEREVLSFVGSLIDQNNEYAEKLEHFDALIRLGESTVIEADKEAGRIKTEAKEEADENTRVILNQ
ncbi:MAG: hypothetical protein WBC47_04765, partial [Dehalococcoidia bacterium]